MNSKVPDHELLAFVKTGVVTPEQIALKFGLAPSTALKRMSKLERAGKVVATTTIARGGCFGSGNGRRLTYHLPKSSVDGAS